MLSLSLHRTQGADDQMATSKLETSRTHCRETWQGSDPRLGTCSLSRRTHAWTRLEIVVIAHRLDRHDLQHERIQLCERHARVLVQLALDGLVHLVQIHLANA